TCGGFSTKPARARCTSLNARWGSLLRRQRHSLTSLGRPSARCADTRVRLPDFIIGGAPRSGTTWLYWLLDRHPHVYLAKPVTPEPKFFLVDRIYEKGL